MSSTRKARHILILEEARVILSCVACHVSTLATWEGSFLNFGNLKVLERRNGLYMHRIVPKRLCLLIVATTVAPTDGQNLSAILKTMLKSRTVALTSAAQHKSITPVQTILTALKQCTHSIRPVKRRLCVFHHFAGPTTVYLSRASTTYIWSITYIIRL